MYRQSIRRHIGTFTESTTTGEKASRQVADRVDRLKRAMQLGYMPSTTMSNGTDLVGTSTRCQVLQPPSIPLAPMTGPRHKWCRMLKHGLPIPSATLDGSSWAMNRNLRQSDSIAVSTTTPTIDLSYGSNMSRKRIITSRS